jgi:hypothetical protein
MEFGDSRVRVSVFQVSSGLFSPLVSSAVMMWDAGRCRGGTVSIATTVISTPFCAA